MSGPQNTLSRREFAALSLAAGVAATSGVHAAGQVDVVETEFEIAAADGMCEAVLVHPKSDAWPGVILFTDVFGLRRTMRDMAKRLAADGFSVLIPNPFYRSARAPGLSTDMDFNNPVDRSKIDRLRAPLTGAAVARDVAAYVRFLDLQSSVDQRIKLGVFGYCMGGAMTLQAAAAAPERIGAGASFHGGGLVTGNADSPHLSIPKIKAQFYIAVAENDHRRRPDARSCLGRAFAAAGSMATIDVYEGCLHGWCVQDMPPPLGAPSIFVPADAERAWRELTKLFRRALV
jgi:carboxymethylenebutenolidase